jgi:hypothetical protein
MNIQQLARNYADLFKTGTRLQTGDKFLYVKTEEVNEALLNLIRNAHGDMSPDDYKYQFIHEALEAIAESDNPEDINLEPDCYNHALLKWLSSNTIRVNYCNDAIENMLAFKDEMDFMAIISMAQSLEKDEVFQSVRASLESIMEELKNG